jgi:hypothetical protein
MQSDAAKLVLRRGAILIAASVGSGMFANG